MSPLRKVAQAVAFSSALQVAMLPSVLAGTPTVCDNPQLSCQSSLSTTSSCCLNSPGGQLLLTQFWDTNPPTGPTDSWTLHGLWPDKCDGTFEAHCDSSRAYSDIIDILTSFGATDILDFMNTYWKDYQGQDERFWSHEWNKHGTCISTLSPDCYTDYTPQQEVVDFFNITTALFQTLPTYTTLANAGIVPSTTTTYRAADIEAAIQAVHGYPVTIGCKNGAFDQVWYHYNVQGSVQTGTFIATTPDGTKSTCPTQGIRYLPKA